VQISGIAVKIERLIKGKGIKVQARMADIIIDYGMEK
jgi:hypothetical protein